MGSLLSDNGRRPRGPPLTRRSTRRRPTGRSVRRPRLPTGPDAPARSRPRWSRPASLPSGGQSTSRRLPPRAPRASTSGARRRAPSGTPSDPRARSHALGTPQHTLRLTTTGPPSWSRGPHTPSGFGTPSAPPRGKIRPASPKCDTRMNPTSAAAKAPTARGTVLPLMKTSFSHYRSHGRRGR